MPLIRRWKFFRLSEGGYGATPEFPHDLTVRRSSALMADIESWYISDDALDRSALIPVYIGHWYTMRLHIWLYAHEAYATEDADLSPDDVDALIHEQSNRRRIQIERARAVRSMTEQLDAGVRRERIAQAVKVAVWQRDGGRCVECDSNKDLEFDHIIPLAMGGSNTERNLQLLCADCNRRKGATLG